MWRKARCLALLAVAASIGGCTGVVQLRNAKTGETVSCGGEMWSFESGDRDQHCLDYWHKLGYEPVH
jgi:uncharacterized protein YceK